MENKQNFFVRFWRWFTKESVRLWFFRFCGVIWAALSALGSWCITAVMLTCIAAALNYYFDLLTNVGYDIWTFIAGCASGVTAIAVVYFIISSMEWARKMAEMDKAEFEVRALITGLAVATTVLLGLIGLGCYQLYKFIF